jgi:hypothetical protein
LSLSLSFLVTRPLLVCSSARPCVFLRALALRALAFPSKQAAAAAHNTQHTTHNTQQ